jgi:hypothetical protein
MVTELVLERLSMLAFVEAPTPVLFTVIAAPTTLATSIDTAAREVTLYVTVSIPDTEVGVVPFVASPKVTVSVSESVDEPSVITSVPPKVAPVAVNASFADVPFKTS